MSDRPRFIDDLRNELATGAENLARRREKLRRLVRAGGGLMVGAAAIAAVVGLGALGGLGGFGIGESTTQVQAVDERPAESEDGTPGQIDEATDPRSDRDQAQPETTASAEQRELGQPLVNDDGTAIYDVGLSTGERFRLTVPTPFAGDLTIVENQGTDPIAIDGTGGRMAITFEPCAERDLDPDTTVIVRCGQDELLTLSIEPTVPLTSTQVELFDLRTISSGARYGPVLVSAHPELGNCGNCSPWGPMAYPARRIVINKTGPSSAAAVDIESLEEVWRTSERAAFALIATEDGILLDLEAGPVIKLDLEGEERWRVERQADEDQLTVFGPFLLTSYGGADNNKAPLVRRIDMGTGEVEWVTEGRIGADWQSGSPVMIDDVIVAPDVTDVGMTGPSATLQAFDVKTGEATWTTALATAARSTDSVAVEWFEFEDGQALLAATSDGIIARIEPATGRTRWQTATPLGEFNGTDFAADGTLAVDISSPSGRTLLDPDTGAILFGGVTGPDFSCPVTIPPRPGFTPPEPWPARPVDGESVWFGSAELWTPLRTQGHQPRKSVWWSADFPGGSVEGQPEIRVVYQRLDPDAGDSATVIFESPGTNAYTVEDRDFMINGIEPDDPGCWQATATYKGTSLNYVYEVG